MALVMIMEFDGVEQRQYDEVIRELDLRGETPSGQLLHMAGGVPGGWRVVDVWESQGAFDVFLQSKLGRAMQNQGIPAPRLTVFPLHGAYGAIAV